MIAITTAFDISGFKSLDDQWLEKFNELSACGRKPTGPHLSVPPDNYDPNGVFSVLYVGKALGKTAHPLKRPTANERRTDAADFFRTVQKGCYKSDFWEFARQLSAAVAIAGGGKNVPPLSNLVWTNVSKIGVADDQGRPPPAEIQTVQQELAIKTLRKEIEVYRPKLIAWVLQEYGFEIVRAVAGGQSEEGWVTEQQEVGRYFKWRLSDTSKPAMIWTDHPQGKGREHWAAWIGKACELVRDAT